MRRSFYITVTKRLIDVVCAAIGLGLTLPVVCLVATLIRIRMGPPIFFLQQRAGLNGREFNIVKFRTMSASCDSQGKPLPDTDRLTPLGRFLRKHSLDEIPQLWNVFRGDMSLVGPRPLLARYLDRYTEFQARRHEVRPGITGLAQVRGRNALAWEDRFELDVWYVEHITLTLDLWIMIATIAKIWRTSDTTPENLEETPEFLGTMED